MTWHNIIRQAWKTSGMSLYRLSKTAGVPYPRVREFMVGETTDIRLHTVEKLSRVLDLELRAARRTKKGG